METNLENMIDSGEIRIKHPISLETAKGLLKYQRHYNAFKDEATKPEEVYACIAVEFPSGEAYISGIGHSPGKINSSELFDQLVPEKTAELLKECLPEIQKLLGDIKLKPYGI